MPLLSVITVAFNSARTIEDTIQSVRAQRNADFEHVIVDGGSTDGTMEIIDKYRDGLAAVISEPDKGIYDAMNKGVALARGTFLGCLNSDDYFASSTSLASIQNALATGDLDCVWGDLVHVDATGRPVRLMSGRIFRARLLRFAIMPPHPTFYARTEVIRRVGGFSLNYRIAADFDLMLKLFQLPGFAGRHIDKIITAMRMGGVSTDGLSATRLVSRELLIAMQANAVRPTGWGVRVRYPLKAKELLYGKALSARGRRFPAGVWLSDRDDDLDVKEPSLQS